MMHFGIAFVVSVVLLGQYTVRANVASKVEALNVNKTSVNETLGNQLEADVGRPAGSVGTVDKIKVNGTVNKTLDTQPKGAVGRPADPVEDSMDGNQTEKDLINETSATNIDSGIYVLPEKWTPFCDVSTETYESIFTNHTDLISVRCRVNQMYSGIWSMADLRENLNMYNDSARKFAVDIECIDGANISLFWPIKVNNLMKFQVRGCLLVDYLSEHDSEILKLIPDSLRVLEISDIQILISINTFIHLLKNTKNTPEEYNCGHQTTVEKMTTRNVSFTFLEPPETVFANLMEIGEQFLLDSKRIAYKCDYQHLMYLDESMSSSMSVYHMSIISESAIYHELRTYNLSYNSINALKAAQLEWSAYFPKLEMYDLSHNDISALYWFELPLHQRMDRITTINLQYNNITTFTVKDLERFKQMPMVFIDLRNNPLFCNCTDSFKELLDYVHVGRYKNISNIADYSYIKDLTCAAPESVMGKTLGTLGIDDLPCDKVFITESETEYFVVPVVTLSVAVVLLAIIVLVILKYRKEVLIILYTRFHIIVPCQSSNFNDDKQYDAFVSYSSNDDEFVENFFEKLEQPSEDTNSKTFKFCLHHRDFVLGKTIFSNICNSVENSRHTIILLSRGFIKSQYCVYEFQEAFRQSIMEKKRHLIIVMMDDVPTDELPKDLKRCIKTFTYIRKDDYLFNDRLIYALSVKQKSKCVKEENSKIDTTKPKTTNAKLNKAKMPKLKIQQNGIVNQNFEYDRNETELGDVLTVVNENDVGITNDIDYDRCISTGSADTGYSSDFIPSPTSTVCSSPTYQIPENPVIESVA